MLLLSAVNFVINCIINSYLFISFSNKLAEYSLSSLFLFKLNMLNFLLLDIVKFISLIKESRIVLMK